MTSFYCWIFYQKSCHGERHNAHMHTYIYLQRNIIFHERTHEFWNQAMGRDFAHVLLRSACTVWPDENRVCVMPKTDEKMHGNVKVFRIVRRPL
jgi:hypothetical protein